MMNIRILIRTPMKKLFLIAGAFFLIVLTSETIYNYTCINLPSTPYHYLQLNEMPDDVQNTTFPLATIIVNGQTVLDSVRNMDNLPFSVGLNGQPNINTDPGVALGRVLFYDVALSFNQKVSCASCHAQEFGFSDSARFSRGFNGGLTGRNSMGLQHVRFHKVGGMFWDLRASSLEDQVTRPIRDAVEMGMTPENLNNKVWDSIVNRLRVKSFYPQLFNNAFGSTLIDSQRIALALAQFVRAINSYGSKWRKTIDSCNCNPETGQLSSFGFTAQEQLGRDLFMDTKRGNCQACHTRNIFVPQGAQNNGVDGSIGPGGRFVWTPWSSRNDYSGKDSGLAGLKALGVTRPYPEANWNRDTGNIKANIGRFKVPSLINISLTGPYMHDGRYKTLDEVINFYSDSVKNNSYNSLSLFLRKIDTTVHGAPNNVTNQLAIDTAPVRIIHYSATEKAALKAFLLTMTDMSIVNDPKFSNPFCVATTPPTTPTDTTHTNQPDTSHPTRPDVTPRPDSTTNNLTFSVNVFPNPSRINSPLNINVTCKEQTTVNMRIISILGRQVYKSKTIFQPGSTRTILPTGVLNQPGIYFIMIENSNGTNISKKIVVQ